MQQLEAKLDAQLAIIGGLSSKKCFDLGELGQSVISPRQSTQLVHVIPTVKDFIECVDRDYLEIREKLIQSSDA